MTQAELLIQLRNANHLSQKEVAEELGVTRQAISRWEAGDAWPSMENLVALSRVYGVSLEEMTQTGTVDADHTSPSEPEKGEKLRFKKRAFFSIVISAFYIAVYIWGELTNSRSMARAGMLFTAVLLLLLLLIWFLQNLYISIRDLRKENKK